MESEESNKRTLLTSGEESEKMKEVFQKIQEQITHLNRHLLTIADIGATDLEKLHLEAGELLLSWRHKNPTLISKHALQQVGNSWSHAFARALAALMKQAGIFQGERLPTAEKLVAEMDANLLPPIFGLTHDYGGDVVASLLLKNYNCKLVTHRHPRMDNLKANQDFERFIEQRLALGPVAISFFSLRSYANFNPTAKEIFRPSAFDIESIRREKLDGHNVVITGRGVAWIDGECVEFWEIHETRGGNFGDGGFTRLERHKGLINVVYELELVTKEDSA